MFGHCNATEELIDLLLEKGITEEELQKEITDILEHKTEPKKEEKTELPKEEEFVSKFVIPNEFLKESEFIKYNAEE